MKDYNFVIQITLTDVDLLNSPDGKLVPGCTLKCIHSKKRRFIRPYDLVDYENLTLEHQQRITVKPKFIINIIGASAPNDYLLIEIGSGSRGR